MSSGVKNINFRCVFRTKEIFFWQSGICRFLHKIWTLLWKSVKEIIPQITVLEFTKSAREKMTFPPFTQKQLEIYDWTKDILNTLSHRLLWGIIWGTNEIYAFFITQPQCCLTFLWNELQMSLRCCLVHISIIILRQFLYLLLV